MVINNGVSVVICCYNSEARLSKTLQHIAKQNVEFGILWEVIIVNNNSNDRTSEVAKLEWEKYNCRAQFKIINEIKPGLSFTREKGIIESKFEYILFCDDDNWLNEDYIQTVVELLNNDNKIAAVGGYGTAVSNSVLPEWFEKYEAGYAVGKRGCNTGYLNGNHLLTGAGMAFRKSLYLEAFSKLPSLLTDRKGDELSSGGDSEICLRFMLMGYRLYFDERLVFKHFIPAERLTLDYKEKLHAGFAQASHFLSIYSSLILFKNYNFITKTIFAIKSMIILSITIPCKIKRWNYNDTINNLYLLTGWPLKNIHPNIKGIRNAFVKK